ncbi:hypothetical protein KPZU09_24810 [Klebsiella pneumoniae]|uniref:Bacterial Ig-like domain-containing protein n=1 Tax=Klebsiella pneumoniae TaxID=573 RepID=A0A919HR54_KLEPN|nr:hypothetical protein KPZU09_24810 [Klebsiella pneumoniae]
MTDVAGNTSGHSPDFVLTVDTTVAPVSDLQVTDDVAQHTGPLTSGGLTNDATPALSGTAEAGSTVTIYDGSTVLGTAVADEDGHWRFTPDPLGEGAPPQHHGDRCGGEHQRPLAGLCAHGGHHRGAGQRPAGDG